MGRAGSTLAAGLTLGLATATSAQVSNVVATQARAHYQVAQDLISKESFAEAEPELKAAIGLDPGFVMAHYSLGQTYMALKRYPDAVTAYLGCREAVLRQATLSQADQAAVDRERRDELRELQTALDNLRHSKTAEIQKQMAIEQRIRFLEQANLRSADQRLAIPAELLLALGSAYFRQNLFEDAEREYRAAIAADKKLGAAHNNLAFICMQTGRLEEAKQELKLAEKAGFQVHPQFKKDLEDKIKAAKQ